MKIYDVIILETAEADIDDLAEFLFKTCLVNQLIVI